MLVSQKCQYAIRALFELARHGGDAPVKIADIARVQAIPPRFLEVILFQLKQAGFVTSQRGNEGGYALARPATEIVVGDVVRFLEGPIGPVECVAGSARNDCPLHANCVFRAMWKRAGDAVSAVYDGTSFQDLVDEDLRRTGRFALQYAI